MLDMRPGRKLLWFGGAAWLAGGILTTASKYGTGGVYAAMNDAACWLAVTAGVAIAVGAVNAAEDRERRRERHGE